VTSRERSRENVFAALSLDRAAERREDAAWLAQQAQAERARFVLIRSDGRALVDAELRGLRTLSAGERVKLFGDADATFLGSAQEAEHFALSADDAVAERIAAELGAQYLDLRSAGLKLPGFDAGLFAYARALSHWRARTGFCSACGGRNEFLSAGHRARCTSCGSEHFPRTDPAVIMLVTWRDACLLGRQAGWPEGRWSTLAGFVEPGETLEDAVRREVREEAGVRVGECTYHSSQPWPFPASLMLGFSAHAEDAHIEVGPELAAAQWFEVDDIVRGLATQELVLSSPLSVSYRLIEHWLRETGGPELSAITHDLPFLGARR
jgi:NAD+ diphosphatase